MGRAMDWMVCGYRKNWENLGGRLAGRGGGIKYASQIIGQIPANVN